MRSPSGIILTTDRNDSRDGPAVRAMLAAILLAALLLSACVPPGAELDDPSHQPLPELAMPAAPLPSEDVEATQVAPSVDGPTAPISDPPEPVDPAAAAPDEVVAAPEPMAGDPGSAAAAEQQNLDPAPEPVPDAAPEPEPEPATAEPAAPAAPRPVVLADVADARRDAGLEAPRYADVMRMRIETEGDLLRVTVDVDGDIPTRLGEGEVAGLGVDLFSGAGPESEHQLFADGGSDGWRAFLQTPEGFVAYPGSFGVGGQRLVFEVPWSAIGGGPRDLEVSLFLDWSKERIPLNAQSFDRVPDQDRVPLRP